MMQKGRYNSIWFCWIK